jgi:hypothetical protein
LPKASDDRTGEQSLFEAATWNYVIESPAVERTGSGISAILKHAKRACKAVIFLFLRHRRPSPFSGLGGGRRFLLPSPKDRGLSPSFLVVGTLNLEISGCRVDGCSGLVLRAT